MINNRIFVELHDQLILGDRNKFTNCRNITVMGNDNFFDNSSNIKVLGKRNNFKHCQYLDINGTDNICVNCDTLMLAGSNNVYLECKDITKFDNLICKVIIEKEIVNRINIMNLPTTYKPIETENNPCSICFTYERKVILNCGHSYCPDCINSLKNIICPECRGEITNAIFMF